jgi:hypothetical protein
MGTNHFTLTFRSNILNRELHYIYDKNYNTMHSRKVAYMIQHKLLITTTNYKMKYCSSTYGTFS